MGPRFVGVAVGLLVVQTRRRVAHREVEHAAERAVRAGQPIARLLAAAGFPELARLARTEWAAGEEG